MYDCMEARNLISSSSSYNNMIGTSIEGIYVHADTSSQLYQKPYLSMQGQFPAISKQIIMIFVTANIKGVLRNSLDHIITNLTTVALVKSTWVLKSQEMLSE